MQRVTRRVRVGDAICAQLTRVLKENVVVVGLCGKETDWSVAVTALLYFRLLCAFASDCIISFFVLILSRMELQGRSRLCGFLSKRHWKIVSPVCLQKGKDSGSSQYFGRKMKLHFYYYCYLCWLGTGSKCVVKMEPVALLFHHTKGIVTKLATIVMGALWRHVLSVAISHVNGLEKGKVHTTHAMYGTFFFFLLLAERYMLFQWRPRGGSGERNHVRKREAIFTRGLELHPRICNT